MTTTSQKTGRHTTLRICSRGRLRHEEQCRRAVALRPLQGGYDSRLRPRGGRHRAAQMQAEADANCGSGRLTRLRRLGVTDGDEAGRHGSAREQLRLLGQFSFGQHVRRPESDKQLTLGGVARSELFGSLVSHVTPADLGRDAAQLVQVGAQLDRTLDHDEAERGRLVIDAQARIPITTERCAFDRGRGGCEHDVLAVENEPHRTTCGLPSLRAVATLAVRVPSITNARHSCSVILRIACERKVRVELPDRIAVLHRQRPDTRTALDSRRRPLRTARRRPRGRAASALCAAPAAPRACRRDGPRMRAARSSSSAGSLTNLGITSIYLPGIDNTEIIDTVHSRRALMVPVDSSLAP